MAREYGFPTWRDLVGTVQKTIDEHVDEPSGELAVAFACIRAGDVDGLARLLDAQPGLVTERYPARRPPSWRRSPSPTSSAIGSGRSWASTRGSWIC